MLRTIYLNENGDASLGGEEQIKQWRDAGEVGRLWLDIESKDETLIRELLATFDCDPLAVHDASRERHPPKIEVFENYLFMIFKGMISINDDLEVEHQQLVFFIGEKLVISRHSDRSQSIDALFEESNSQNFKAGNLHLAVRIMYHAASIYLDSILQFEEKLSDLEDDLHENNNDEAMRQLIAYKSKLVRLRRAFSYHTNISEFLIEHIGEQHEDIAMVDLHVVNDLHERLERVESLTQMYYQLCSDMIEGYITIASHQMNQTMRFLTVITAIFVPLSFLAGLYGMNFAYMPELQYHNAYFFLLGGMAAVTTAFLLWFKHKRWL